MIMGDRMNTELIIGTYTRGGSQGIYRVFMDAEGRFSAPELLCEARDPSYLVVRGESMFAVDEQQGCGGVVCYVRRDGAWHAVRTMSSGGGFPCHLALSPDGGTLAVANYEDGAVSMYAVRDGVLTGDMQTIPGRSDAPGAGRQERSHAHQCVFVGDELWVCDLGCDMVRAFSVCGGIWREGEPVMRLPAGAGPRHMVRGAHGEAYVLGELDSRLHVFLPRNGRMEHAAAIPLTPADRAGALPAGADNSGAGAIRMTADGERIVCTTRQDHRVCLLEIGPDGMPVFAGSFDCGGLNPRDTQTAGDLVICACQDGGGLTSHRMEANGAVRTVDAAPIPAPVCIIKT